MTAFFEKHPIITAAFVGYGFGTVLSQLIILLLKVFT